MVDNLIRNLWARTKITPAGCWEWQGAKTAGGYGEIWWDGKTWYVHRLAAWLSLGLNLNTNYQSLHKCDNPSCWRWSHLFIGTNKDNINDRNRKGRNVRERTHCIHGHELTPENTYVHRFVRRCLICKRTRYA